MTAECGVRSRTDSLHYAFQQHHRLFFFLLCTLCEPPDQLQGQWLVQSTGDIVGVHRQTQDDGKQMFVQRHVIGCAAATVVAAAVATATARTAGVFRDHVHQQTVQQFAGGGFRLSQLSVFRKQRNSWQHAVEADVQFKILPQRNGDIDTFALVPFHMVGQTVVVVALLNQMMAIPAQSSQQPNNANMERQMFKATTATTSTTTTTNASFFVVAHGSPSSTSSTIFGRFTFLTFSSSFCTGGTTHYTGLRSYCYPIAPIVFVAVVVFFCCLGTTTTARLQQVPGQMRQDVLQMHHKRWFQGPLFQCSQRTLGRRDVAEPQFQSTNQKGYLSIDLNQRWVGQGQYKIDTTSQQFIGVVVDPLMNPDQKGSQNVSALNCIGCTG